MRELLRLVRLERARAALALAMTSVTVLAGMGLLGTGAYLLSKAALHPPTVLLLMVPIVGVRFFSLTRAASRYVDRLLAHDVALRLLARLRVRVYGAIARQLPPALLERSGAEWLRQMTADVDRLQNFYLDIVAPPLTLLLVVIVVAAFLDAAGGPRLVWPAVIGLSASGFLAPALGSHLRRRTRARLQTAETRLARDFTAASEGIADLLMNRRGGAARKRLLAESREAAEERRKLDEITSWTSALTLLATGVTALIELWQAAGSVRSGALPGVDAAALVLVTMAAFEAVGPLSRWHLLSDYLETGGRLLPEAPPSRGIEPPALQDFALHATSLSYRYGPEGPWILRRMSFSLAEGSHVVLVGPSGTGKSTLALILAGLLTGYEGSVRLGGVDVRRLDEERRSDLVTLLDQRPHLFDTTLEENVRLGRPGIGPREVRWALEASGLEELLRTLPDGMATQVGEGGSRLSGGERQRVALARILLSKARIVILDEPLTGLDSETARRVTHNLRSWSEGRTVLYITHRALPGWPCDALWRLDGGTLEIVDAAQRLQLAEFGASG